MVWTYLPSNGLLIKRNIPLADEKEISLKKGMDHGLF